MPRQHAPTFIETIAKEVFELFEEKDTFSLAAYKPAFRDAAHRHDIWHHREKGQYNYFFGVVMKEVKLLIKKHNKAQPQEMRREISIPQLDPGKLRFSRDLNF